MHGPMMQKRFTGASQDPAVEARLDAVLQELYGFYHTDIDLKLDRTFRFLARLGNPHLRLPPVVHIAGTNGKGSTLATLRALYEAAGQTVHAYTSPHLIHVTERVLLAGQPISSERLLALLTECIEINDGEPITFFELFTAAVLLEFSRVPADVVLLETGMGGRLDSTNVVPMPAATIITMISYDHMKFLGGTLPEIAFEKAGIMKPGVPCIIGRQTDEAVAAGVPEVFQKRSRNLSPEAQLVRFGAEWSTALESGRMLFRYGDDSINLPPPALLGAHQIWNAGCALAAFRVTAPEHFKQDILSTAMGNIFWPGRLQTLENHAFCRLVPPLWEIVIDGGHNDTGGMVLADQMNIWTGQDKRPLHLIVAMVDRKDPVAFLKPILPFATSLTAVPIGGGEPCFSPEALAATAKALGFQAVSTAASAQEGVLAAVRAGNVQSPARILMTGSLYFMGEILAEKSKFSL